MKTTLPFYILLLTCTFIIQSCQKELSDPGGNIIIINPLPVVDSNYLSKIYGISISGPLSDTGIIYTYNYDNLKRVVSINGLSKDLYNYTQISYTYYYNNSDTVPFKSRAVSISANDPAQTMLRHDTTITWHFFDNTGRNTRDSMIHSVGNPSVPVPYYSTLEIRNYSYGSGKIYGYRSFTGIYVPNPSYVFPDQKDTANIDALGNVTSNKAYRFNTISSQFELETTSAFTYDSKQSPFSRLSNFKTFGVFPSGETLFMELPQYSNHVTQNEVHSLSMGGGGVHFDFSYTNLYNTNGLIKQSDVNEQPPVPSNYMKISYTYIHL